jgi:lipopolysaccharide transport system permease protein
MSEVLSTSPNPIVLAHRLWAQRGLIWQLTTREVVGRYRGSLFGLLWSLFNPLLMLAVYTFVFGVVFRSKWGLGPQETKLDFAMMLFAGLIVFSIFGECMNRSPGLILANPNYVKKVVFPLDIMPIVLVLSAIFHAAVSLAILLATLLVTRGALPWTVVLLPIVLIPVVAVCLGVSWFLSSLGVYIRDTGQVMGVVTSTLLFLSPIFFPSSALSEEVRLLIKLNPLSFPIEQAREVLMWGRPPSWDGLLVYTVASLLVLQAGYWWFQRTRRGLADVM